MASPRGSFPATYYYLTLCVLLLPTADWVVQSEDVSASTSPPANYDKAQHCCAEPNILERPCRTKTLFNCTHGSYILDPWIEPADAFDITTDGGLEFVGGDLPTDDNNYCISRYGREPNETRFVALVCFAESDSFQSTLFTAKGSLALVSVIFLAITIYVYNVIVMRDTQDRVVRIALICLLAFFLLLGTMQLLSGLLIQLRLCTLIGEWARRVVYH